MTWDPFGTLGQALWIGGGQWAGKSTVSNLLAHRHGLTAYHVDYHAARGHWDRRVVAAGGVLTPPTPESMFVAMPPASSALDAIHALEQCFEYTLDDLRALVSGRPIVAEGWALRPRLVAPILPSPRQMLVMVPTDEFRLHQSRMVDRAGPPKASDPALAQANRIERDRLVAQDAVEQARALDIRVLEVDGSVHAEAVADVVAEHFGLDSLRNNS